ncbi:MAG: transposase [Candidatus Paceibacterota bacterium]
MGLRRTPLVSGEYYHIYNRGVEKREIFLDKEDYFYFLKLLYICNSKKSIKLRKIEKNFERGETIVNIGAYCLMPNHFHLLCHEKTENGISVFMKKLLTAYAMYFNKKYERNGVLFQGRFKSEHASTDKYLKYLYAYIHLNPAKLKEPKWRELKNYNTKDLLNFIKQYPYSSLYEYLNDKIKITNPASFPDYFQNAKDHLDELFQWLSAETTQDRPV